MTNPELNAEIKAALLENPHVAEVLSVRSFAPSGAEFIGIRVSLTDVQTAADFMPVIATLRNRVREFLPTANIFIEPDVSGPRQPTLNTEAIVIRASE